MIRYYKLAYYNFVKQSKAKQSKAKQSKACIVSLTDNLNFYISQFFKAFNFLSVRFCFAKTLSLRVKRSNLYKLDCHDFLQSLAMTTKNNFAILITRGFNPLRLFAIAHNGLKPVVICKLELQKFNIKLVKTFLTSINFDSLSRKIKNPCLVINILSTGGIQ